MALGPGIHGGGARMAASIAANRGDLDERDGKGARGSRGSRGRWLLLALGRRGGGRRRRRGGARGRRCTVTGMDRGARLLDEGRLERKGTGDPGAPVACGRDEAEAGEEGCLDPDRIERCDRLRVARRWMGVRWRQRVEALGWGVGDPEEDAAAAARGTNVLDFRVSLDQV